MKKRNYAALARAAADAAMNEKFPPELRSYYARLALWADARAHAMRNDDA